MLATAGAVSSHNPAEESTGDRDPQDWRFDDKEYEGWINHARQTLGKRWRFSVDLCASDDNAKTDRFYQDVLGANLRDENIY